MSAAAESLEIEPPGGPASEAEVRTVGVTTRAVSWVLDAVVINVVALIVGVGAALVLSIFPLGKNLKTPLEAIAGAAYIVWVAVYFIAFWWITGQTPGARVMQVRLVRANRGRVKPVRGFVRWVGMNLAMLPLFLGFAPILFGRRGFPDWLAKTLVVEAPQLSLAEARLASLRAARFGQQTGGTSADLGGAPVPGVGPAAGVGAQAPSGRQPP
jgi:uncharacterized RDD family membrane protein YckC